MDLVLGKYMIIRYLDPYGYVAFRRSPSSAATCQISTFAGLGAASAWDTQDSGFLTRYYP